MDMTPTSRNRWLPLTSPLTSPAAASNPDPFAAGLDAPPKNLLPLDVSTKAAASPIVSTSSSTMSPLTPPMTPEKPADNRSPIGSGFETLMSPSSSGLNTVMTFDVACGTKEMDLEMQTLESVPEEPLLYCKEIQIEEVLGEGAWSTVYSATEKPKNAVPLALLPPSPPVSPESKILGRQTKLLAVKVPSEKMAFKVLRKEAQILTYLHTRNKASWYLVPFHGFIANTHTIVMDAVPVNLAAYIKSITAGPLSTKTMFDPAIGPGTWVSLAENLIDGLAFLGSCGCIHGDIKPSNILLRFSEATGRLTPLYCDFSSARIHNPDTPASESEEISAVTKDYVAPELLVALGHPGEHAIATPASDVFALAVTLLEAATGESPYAGVQMDIQKLSMAKMGVPIDFARNGANGTKVMKGRAVAKILGPAVEKDAEKRVTVEAWKVLFTDVVDEWREKGWARGG